MNHSQDTFRPGRRPISQRLSARILVHDDGLRSFFAFKEAPGSSTEVNRQTALSQITTLKEYSIYCQIVNVESIGTEPETSQDEEPLGMRCRGSGGCLNSKCIPGKEFLL